MFLDPLDTIPKRERECYFSFNELYLRERGCMFRDRKMPVHILKLIGQLNLSSFGAIPLSTKFFDEALCRLLSQLCNLDEERKQGENNIRLLFAPPFRGCKNRLTLRLVVEEPTREFG